MDITTQSELGPKGMNIAYRLVERRRLLPPDVGAALVARLEKLEYGLQSIRHVLQEFPGEIPVVREQQFWFKLKQLWTRIKAKW